ncbi:MAG: SDR family NAD(P)-dependent oxidoreductase [Luteolibacter sp.]
MKQAVITGGNGSLGQAIAVALQKPGWKVHTPTRAEMNVCEETAIQSYFLNHPTDLLVCVAGVICDTPLLRLTEDTWDDVFATNFKGAADCAKAVIPQMIENRTGHIIFISSFSALHPPVGQVAYATAKAALLGLTEDLASRYGSSNIRVNTILPGFLETRMTATVTETRRKEVLNTHVLQRFNTAALVGKFIRHLHHDLLHTSGQIFQLDSRIA